MEATRREAVTALVPLWSASVLFRAEARVELTASEFRAVVDIAPVLSPPAATDAAQSSVGAVITRACSRHMSNATVVGDLVCLAMAVFVAWGRFGPESFTG